MSGLRTHLFSIARKLLGGILVAMGQRLVLAFISSTLFVLSLALQMPQAKAQDTPRSCGRQYVSSTVLPDLERWSAMPGPDAVSSSRSWIVRTVYNKGAYCEQIALLNYSTKPIPLTIWMADAHTQNGGYITTNQGSAVSGVGAWTKTLGPSTVVVPPLRYLVVPLFVQIPKYSKSGLHAGGFEARSAFSKIRSEGASSYHYSVAQQIGVRIRFTIPGKDIIAPAWSGLACEANTKQQVQCSVSMTNNGTIGLTNAGNVTLSPFLLGKKSVFSVSGASGSPEVLPTDSFKLRSQWINLVPGLYRVSATMQASGTSKTLKSLLIVPPPIWMLVVSGGVLAFFGWPRTRRFSGRIVSGALKGATQAARGQAA